MNKETKLIMYKNLCEKHEKKCNKRVLIAFSIISVLIFISVLLVKNFQGITVESIFYYIISSFVFAIFDLFIHTIIFSFTLSKNQEESIRLEQIRNELLN